MYFEARHVLRASNYPFSDTNRSRSQPIRYALGCRLTSRRQATHIQTRNSIRIIQKIALWRSSFNSQYIAIIASITKAIALIICMLYPPIGRPRHGTLPFGSRGGVCITIRAAVSTGAHDTLLQGACAAPFCKKRPMTWTFSYAPSTHGR